MNPAGIRVFYGAYGLETCLSEVPPNVGDVIFAARLELMRSRCVLDLSEFQKPRLRLDPFAKDQVQLTSQGQFMIRFEREITRPMWPTTNTWTTSHKPSPSISRTTMRSRLTARRGGSKRLSTARPNLPLGRISRCSALRRSWAWSMPIVPPRAIVAGLVRIPGLRPFRSRLHAGCQAQQPDVQNDREHIFRPHGLHGLPPGQALSKHGQSF